MVTAVETSNLTYFTIRHFLGFDVRITKKDSTVDRDAVLEYSEMVRTLYQAS
jgi:hypothetical protein